LQIIMPGTTFATNGVIKKWRVYTGRDCILSAQVLRPVAVPDNIVSTNDEIVHAFTVVGSNLLYINQLGVHEFDVDESELIQIQAGDILGFFTMNPGCVSWSQGGSSPVLFRYGAPSYNQVKTFQGILAVEPGLIRTYSIECEFEFGVDSDQVLMVATPSESPSPSITPSISFTASPSALSLSPSLTPLISKSSSASATPSVSWSPSVSLSPSPSPSPSLNEMVCTQGLEIVCATRETMVLCNLSEEVCAVTLDLMHLPRPAFLDSPSAELLGH